MVFVVINQINKYKGKLYNQCMNTLIVIKKNYFFSSEYKNEWK